MIIFLRVMCYDLVGGLHFYGTLIRHEDEKRKTVEVVKILSQAEANLLGKTYEKGDLSSRFRVRDRLRQAAVAQYKRHWPRATYLMEGQLAVVEPQLVLDGPGKDELNALYEKCELLGWWDKGHIEEVEEICEAWQALLERHTHETTS